MTLNDKYLIHNSKTKYFLTVLDFVINKPSWKKFPFLKFFQNSIFCIFDVWCSWRGNYESTVKHRSNFEFLNFLMCLKIFFLNISSSVFGASHSLVVSWLCNRDPLYTSQDIEKVAKYSHNEISLFQWRFNSIRFLSTEKCPTESVFILKVTFIL